MSLESLPIHDPNSVRPSQTVEIPEPLIAELNSFGEPEGSNPWSDYSSFELTEEKANFLIAIVDGDSDQQFNGESLCWVPLHAWRILLSRKYLPAIPALLDRLTLDNEDDWAHDDISRGLVAFGPAAIEPIFKEFRSETIFAQESFGYAGILEALTGIVKIHPQERDRVADFLRELLAGFEALPPRLNSFIVFGMTDLVDLTAAPLIQRVYERKFLDESIADWNWVREKCWRTSGNA